MLIKTKCKSCKTKQLKFM